MSKLLYVSSHNIRVIKSGRMRWEGHMAYWAYTGEDRCTQDFGEETHLEGLAVDLENIKMIFTK